MSSVRYPYNKPPIAEPSYDWVLILIFIVMGAALLWVTTSYLRAQDVIDKQQQKIETLQTLSGRPL